MITRKSDLSRKAESIHDVRPRPNRVRIPEIIAARCPQMLTRKSTNYLASDVTWMRTSSVNEYYKDILEKIINYSLESGEIKKLLARSQKD